MTATSAPNQPFSDAERELRCELAACYRIFDQLGWTELIYNHITLRLPGPEHRFLINPFGLRYDEVTASNLVRIDPEGRTDQPGAHPVNPAGLLIHSAIHEHIPQARCIMHVHTTAGMAVACKKSGLAMSNFYAAMLHDQIAYHDFEGVTINPDEKQRLLENLGNRRNLILRNHGLLAWGETLPEAFARLWTLNRACEIQVASQSMSGEDILLPASVCDQAGCEALQFNAKYGAGQDIFDALRRAIDAHDRGYRA